MSLNVQRENYVKFLYLNYVFFIIILYNESFNVCCLIVRFMSKGNSHGKFYCVTLTLILIYLGPVVWCCLVVRT
jgi:hypothetical protein